MKLSQQMIDPKLIMKILNKYDPLGIFDDRFIDDNFYDSHANQIAFELYQVKSSEQLAIEIFDLFKCLYIKNDSENIEDIIGSFILHQDIAKEIWILKNDNKVSMF